MNIKNDIYNKCFISGLMYIVRVCDDGELIEYEYGNLKHATEHFNWENKYDKVELIEYSTIEGTERIVKIK